jgi:hypothetical protein
MAASYDPKTNITYGYLRYLHDSHYHLDRLRLYLQNNASTATVMHPLLIPTFIADKDTSRLLSTYKDTGEKVVLQSLRFASTMTRTEKPTFILPNPLELPIEKIVAVLMKESTFLTAAWQDTESWTLTLPLMRDAIQEISQCAGQSPLFNRACFNKVSDQIVRQLKYAEIQNQSVIPTFHGTSRIIEQLLSQVSESVQF